MNFKDFKEKFDSFFEKVTAEELISEFEQLGCPVDRTDEKFPIESGRELTVSLELTSTFEHFSHFFPYNKYEHQYFFEVETDHPLTCKQLKGKLEADSYFYNGTDIPLAA